MSNLWTKTMPNKNVHPCALHSSIGINNDVDWVDCCVPLDWESFDKKNIFFLPLRVRSFDFFFSLFCSPCTSTVLAYALLYCVCLLKLMRQRANTQLVGLNCQLVVKHIEESYLHSKTNQLPHLHNGVFRTNAKGKKVRSSLALLLISILGTLFVFGWQRVLFCKQCVPQRTHTPERTLTTEYKRIHLAEVSVYRVFKSWAVYQWKYPTKVVPLSNTTFNVHCACYDDT